ncbi:MAG: zinc ribbon domain-containing protein [Prevotella sp.]|nr:zinc ribbon domain-containing protein [Prevotella sp.]
MKSNTLTCPKCGGTISHASSFCEHCGTPIKITVSSIVEVKTDVEEDKTHGKVVDVEHEKQKEEYFKKRAATSVIRNTDDENGAKELSFVPNSIFFKAVLVGGLLLTMTLLVLAKVLSGNALSPVKADPAIEAELLNVKDMFIHSLQSNYEYIYLAVAIAMAYIFCRVFYKAVDKVERRKIRRSLRLVNTFNWIACAVPLFLCIVVLMENFFNVSVPMSPNLFHGILLVICLVISTIVAYMRYLPNRLNKSIGDIAMAVHFDTYYTFSLALAGLLFYIFASQI